jgi:hypothetical protein
MTLTKHGDYEGRLLLDHIEREKTRAIKACVDSQKTAEARMWADAYDRHIDSIKQLDNHLEILNSCEFYAIGSN